MASKELKEVLLLDQKIFEDERGYFLESFNKKIFEKSIGAPREFVQDNVSLSKKNVLRGFHYQMKPFEQGKLVRVLQGSILDVVVDIRKNSNSYGDHCSYIIDSKKNNSLWIPEGFAHAFLALSEETIVYYKTTNFYSKDHEITIPWDDKNICFNWPVSKEDMILSEKDSKNTISLKEFWDQQK